MNARLTALRAALARNKTGLGAAGVAAVALLAWRARAASSKTAATSTSSTAPGVSVSPVSQSAGGYTTGTSGYDSTASDVYNAIQPQLEELRDLWSNAATPIPVPVTPVATPLGYGSNVEWINAATTKWAELGRNPIDIGAALSQYTKGQDINQAQSSGIQWAVSNFGAAPEGVAGSSHTIANP